MGHGPYEKCTNSQIFIAFYFQWEKDVELFARRLLCIYDTLLLLLVAWDLAYNIEMSVR